METTAASMENGEGKKKNKILSTRGKNRHRSRSPKRDDDDNMRSRELPLCKLFAARHVPHEHIERRLPQRTILLRRRRLVQRVANGGCRRVPSVPRKVRSLLAAVGVLFDARAREQVRRGTRRKSVQRAALKRRALPLGDTQQ